MSHIARICLVMLYVDSFVSLEAATFTFATFDYPGSTGTTLGGINDGGQIVGSFNTSSAFGKGFIRNADGSLIPVVLPFPSNDSPASGINSTGEVVGAFFDPSTFAAQGYLRNQAGMYSTIVDPINPNNSGGSAINDGGLIVGGYGDVSNPAFSHGFLRDTSGTFATIDDPNMTTNSSGNSFTQPTGINNLGQIVGTFSDATGTHGFLRSPAGVFSTIDDPNGKAGTTNVMAINNLGAIVGTFNDSFGLHSFIRSADGTMYMTIDVPGGFVTSIRGINDSGEIVGSYLSSLTGGQMHGFIGLPTEVSVPEPASLALFLAGFGIIGAVKLRRG